LGVGWRESALLTLLARDGTADIDFLRRLKSKFASPMIPTPWATADEIQKMVAAQVLVPDSTVTYELYGRMDEPDDRSSWRRTSRRSRPSRCARPCSSRRRPQPRTQRSQPPGSPQASRWPAVAAGAQAVAAA
jgi:hypothetical protein